MCGMCDRCFEVSRVVIFGATYDLFEPCKLVLTSRSKIDVCNGIRRTASPFVQPQDKYLLTPPYGHEDIRSYGRYTVCEL